MIKQQLSFASGVAAITLSTAGCASATDNRMAADSDHRNAASTMGVAVTDQHQSVSQRFADLDEYLLWLKKFEAPADGPWYKEIKPGVYELQTGGNLQLDVPSTEQRIFTREELERKFGFRK